MKKSDLKLEIKKYVSEILSEDDAYELIGGTGAKTVTSFKSSSDANRFKTQNPNVKTIRKLEEKDDSKLAILKKLRGE